MTQTTDAALVEQIRCSATYGYMPMAVRRHLCQAADTIEAQARRIEALEGALRRITAPRFGLQGIQEDYGHDPNAYNYRAMRYFVSETNDLRAIAANALIKAPTP